MVGYVYNVPALWVGYVYTVLAAFILAIHIWTLSVRFILFNKLVGADLLYYLG